MKTVQFELNGNPVSVDAYEDEPLLWVIRQQLGLTGTKFGCGEGFCGSCTVIRKARRNLYTLFLRHS